MVVFIIFAASFIDAIAALIFPSLSDFVLLAVPCAIAILLARDIFGRRRGRKEANHNWIVVDGSNVMYWKDGVPRIETVREVIEHLSMQGFTPGVMFDANAGHLVAGKYKHDGAFGRLLGLPNDRVMVVPTGTPADPAILLAAKDLRARIVTNDRFRDWADVYPEVQTPGHLIKGGYAAGKLWLNLNVIGYDP